jgi:putative ABC transport system permease protein
MNLLSLALRNLKRRPVRTCLSVLGIGLAVGGALAFMSFLRSIQNGTREGIDEIGGDLIVMDKGASDIFGGSIPERTVERIAAISDVVRVSGVLVAFAPGGGSNNVLTFGWPDASDLWKRVPLREGRVPAPGEPHAAVLGGSAAASLGRKLNDEVELFGETFRVVGIAGYASSVNRGLALVPLADLQEAMDRPRHVTIANVTVDKSEDRTELARIREQIETLGNVVAAAPDEVLDHDRNFAILDAVSHVIAIIAVAVSALNVLTVLVVATHERTREIGILAAIGWSKGRIVKFIVIEGILMCAIGCGLGVLFGFLAEYAFPRIPTIGTLISFKSSVGLIAPVISAAFLLCVLGALLPAWRAARMLPAEALRRM